VGGGHLDFFAELVVCLDCALVLVLVCSKFLLLLLLPKFSFCISQADGRLESVMLHILGSLCEVFAV